MTAPAALRAAAAALMGERRTYFDHVEVLVEVPPSNFVYQQGSAIGYGDQLQPGGGSGGLPYVHSPGVSPGAALVVNLLANVIIAEGLVDKDSIDAYTTGYDELAQRAAEYGARVAIVESARLGGTCVNVGCVPKKVMWNAAQIAHAAHDAAHYGFDLTLGGHDWSALRTARDAYIARLNGIYERNLGNRKVDLFRGHAAFVAPNEVRVGDTLLEAPQVVIATGGRPSVPAIPGAEYGITSDGFFELADRPQRVAVVGSGYIAVELAGVFAALGSEVTMVLRRDRVLRNFEAMLGTGLRKIMEDDGVTFLERPTLSGDPELLTEDPDHGGPA
jgi:hypothetical protein